MKKPFTVGTRSVLCGAHAFWYHPFAVARAWNSLYGFPWHPALWLCFFFHDIGYLCSPNMDGPEGEEHPLLGAEIVHFLVLILTGGDFDSAGRWSNECLYHSRYYAKANGQSPSRLCMADKLAPLYTPAWLYLPGAHWSGELAEYMANAKKAKPEKVGLRNWELLTSDDPRKWYAGLRNYMQAYVADHKDGQTDNVTEIRHTV